MTETELNRRWAEMFPRLAELSESLESSSSYGEFFVGIHENTYRHSMSREVYERVEKDLATLEHQAWRDFKNKVVQNANGDRGLLVSFFNEATGYRYLKDTLANRELDYDTIQQPRMSGTKGRPPKEPDWVALACDKVVAAVEVKTVFASEKETDWFETNTLKLQQGEPLNVRRIDPTIPSGLRSKITADTNTAKCQLQALDPFPNLAIAYIIVNVDFGPANAKSCRETLVKHIGRLSDSDVDVVGDLRGLFTE